MAAKQSLYFPEEMLREIMSESNRLDRSLSWTVQQAWRLARAELSRARAPSLPAGVPRPAGSTAACSPSAPSSCAPARVPSDRAVAPAERGPSAQVLEFLKGKFETAAH